MARIGILIGLTLLGFTASMAQAEDWPQWQGPRRDSVWNETGLLHKFPDAGPKVLWRKPVRYGYAGPAVANGRVYVPDFVTNVPDIEKLGFKQQAIPGSERLLCLDAKTGEQLWVHEYPVTYNLQYPAGPRCTPTVHDGKVYFLGTEGDLICLDAVSGKPVWQKKFQTDFNAKTPIWGFSGHPLIVDGLLIVVTGGSEQMAVALDCKTGVTKWTALNKPAVTDPGYSPPTLIEHGGQRQILVWDTVNLNSVEPATGKLLWSVPIEVSYKMPVMAPRVSGDLLYASGVEQTAATLKLNAAAEPTVLWRAKPKQAVFSVNSAPFVHQGHVFGANVDGDFVCASLKDGARVWSSFLPTTGSDLGGKKNRSGTAFIVKNGERFFIMSETGHLLIAELSPEKYTEISRFKLLEPTGTAWNRPLVWSHPAFAQKCIFARNDQEIVCASLAE